MEDDQVPFLPAMCIDILRFIDLSLHIIDYLSHLLNIVHDRNIPSLRVTCGESVYTATMDLEEGPFWIEGVSPNHLEGLNVLA
jgi:hypothetical protein